VTGTLFVTALLVVAGASPAIVATDAGAATGSADVWATTTHAPQQDGATLQERIVASRNADPGSVTLTFEYRVPDVVTGLRVGIPVLSIPGITVAGTDGFERTEAARFRWDTETTRPSVTLRLAVGDELGSGVRGVDRGDWALVSQPNTRVQVRTDDRPLRTTSFGVASGEPGYASSHLAYLGAHERRTVPVADEEATFVLGAADADPTRAAAFLATANEHFDFGVRRDRVTVFVLPLNDDATTGVDAATVDTAFWVGRAGLRIDDTGAVFTHEYVHTRLGTVGVDDARWLTEASAEYYGHLFALNDGVGDYESFRSGLRATEYAPDRQSAVLSNPETWRGTTAQYDKGAHVLAALDAEIRRRTDGDRTLRDVFAGRSEPFRDYRAFRTAVIELTGDDSLGPWLDSYVTTDALPPLPENPRYYVAEPSLDPDGDGTPSGAELARGDHPFVAGAGPDGAVTTPTAAAAGTDTEEATTTPPPTGTEGSAPGFGVAAALAALLIATIRRTRR
jgi:PGF-CTERM protein